MNYASNTETDIPYGSDTNFKRFYLQNSDIIVVPRELLQPGCFIALLIPQQIPLPRFYSDTGKPSFFNGERIKGGYSITVLFCDEDKLIKRISVEEQYLRRDYLEVDEAGNCHVKPLDNATDEFEIIKLQQFLDEKIPVLKTNCTRSVSGAKLDTDLAQVVVENQKKIKKDTVCYQLQLRRKVKRKEKRQKTEARQKLEEQLVSLS